MTRARERRASGGEFALIADIARELARGPRSQRVEVGIGDDAAVLRLGRDRLVVSVDDQAEGVHFRLQWLSPEDVGYRSLQAAVSDLAAMGATPLCAVASLHVPRDFPRAKLRLLARGQAEAARELGCPVVGGNVTRAARLGVTTTVLGTTLRPLLRSGARPGDELWIFGAVGLARAGWLLHEKKPRLPPRLARISAEARAAWARPRALLAQGRALPGRAHAAIDVSDGLAGDARQLASASRVRVVLERARVTRLVSSELRELGSLLGEPGPTLALRGGEDYALLCAGPAGRRPRGAKVIGRVERGEGAQLELEDERRIELEPGFDHLG